MPKTPKDTFIRAKMAKPDLERHHHEDQAQLEQTVGLLVSITVIVLVLVALCAVAGAYLTIYRAVHHLP